MKTLNIKTADGASFNVDWDIIQKSQTIKTMIEDLGIDQNSIGDDTIPLFNEEVTGPVFKKVIEWCEKNRAVPDSMEVDDEEEDELFKKGKSVSGDDLNDWEKKYINMSIDEMFPLLICGNFLEIKGLVQLMTKAVALQMQGKTVEEMRKNLDLPDPKWTEEELQKLREESAWAFDDKK